MKKAETCMYNANRASNAIFNPYCTWRPFDEATPPHIYWASKGVTDEICSRCKAYKKFKEEK